MAYDIEETLDIEGHDVVKVSYPISSYVADKGFNDYIVRILDKDNFDCIFTMNYIPALAKISFLRKIIIFFILIKKKWRILEVQGLKIYFICRLQ